MRVNMNLQNANELRRQIEDKKRREREEKQKRMQDDLAMELKVKEDLKLMNKKFLQEMKGDKGDQPEQQDNTNQRSMRVNNSMDLSQKSLRRSKMLDKG